MDFATSTMHKARQMLLRLEWSGLEYEPETGTGIRRAVPCCPVCLAKMREDDHEKGCELAALIEELDV